MKNKNVVDPVPIDTWLLRLLTLTKNVEFIPTPEVVPNPTDSLGSKYNSLLRLKLYKVEIPKLSFSFLVFSVNPIPATYEVNPVVPFWLRRTLILDNLESIFKILICSFWIW